MRTVYLKNFRKGFATNSSSTHSVIYRNKEDLFKDLDIFELNYYDRFDNTIAASKEAKIKYVAANIMWHDKLYEIMSLYYPQMNEYKELIKKTKNKETLYGDDEKFGMCARGRLYFGNSKYLEASIDYLRNVIDNDDIIIVGGSDETDFVWETIEGHKTLPQPDEINEYNDNCNIVKNGNYWVGFGYNGKVRFSNSNDKCIPSYPELIDLKITNQCDHGCNFCYMDSNMQGKHADINFLKKIISRLSSNDSNTYDTRVEFSIGGGNVLLYPHLEELFSFMKEKRHIINTTINVKDCSKILNDSNLLKVFKKYVNGIGVSVNSDENINDVKEFKEKLNDTSNYPYYTYKEIVIHMIPELLGREKTKNLLKKLYDNNLYDILFLGYKTNGRGVTQKNNRLTNEDLTYILEDAYSINVDTTFANTYKDWLQNNFDIKYSITFEEGEYSMYIDGVTENAYKSSYQLDKPYNLTYTTMNLQARNKEWFEVIDAFKNIRKDNGFENIEKE